MTQQQTVFNYRGQVLELDPTVANGGESLPAPTGKYEPETSVKENGQRCHEHKKGSYFMPTDAAEDQHEITILVHDGKLGQAPVKSPAHVLDLATGTGTWAIQYAKENPGSNVIGMDQSAMPRKSSVSNCSFVQRNAESDDWGFSHKFDYIHLRYVITCFDDTRSVIQKAFDSLNPGGYIELYDPDFEFIDFDGTLQGTAYQQWAKLVCQGAMNVGRDMAKATKYSTWCREVGFVDVEEKMFVLPSGTWAKGPKMKRVGLSPGQTEELVTKAAEDVQNPGIHSGLVHLATHARKPE